MFTELCVGGEGTFLHTVLFWLSDVEHSCLPGSLHLVGIKKSRENLDLIQNMTVEIININIEWEGLRSSWRVGGVGSQCNPPPPPPHPNLCIIHP